MPRVDKYVPWAKVSHFDNAPVWDIKYLSAFLFIIWLMKTLLYRVRDLHIEPIHRYLILKEILQAVQGQGDWNAYNNESQ